MMVEGAIVAAAWSANDRDEQAIYKVQLDSKTPLNLGPEASGMQIVRRSVQKKLHSLSCSEPGLCLSPHPIGQSRAEGRWALAEHAKVQVARGQRRLAEEIRSIQHPESIPQNVSESRN
jgi:hypothetical protein